MLFLELLPYKTCAEYTEQVYQETSQIKAMNLKTIFGWYIAHKNMMDNKISKLS